MTDGASAEPRRGGSARPRLSADRVALRIAFGSPRLGRQRSVEVGCVAMLAIAVLIQGIVVALGLPGRVELLASLAAVVLVVWVVIVAVRSGASIAVPYLVIAFVGLLVIAALRSDDLLRLIISAHNFLLFPTLALALAALGPSERRNRTVILAIVGLVVVQFVVTVGQALAGLPPDLTAGTFGDHAGWSTAFAAIAGACLALGVFAARAGGVLWVAPVVVLPLCTVWGAHRIAIAAAPLALGVVVVAAWWASGSRSDRKARRRVSLATAGAALLTMVALVGAFAVARPSDLELFTDPGQLERYLRTSDVTTTVTKPASLTGDTGEWAPFNHEAFGRTPAGSGRALWLTPSVDAAYAGVRDEDSEPLRPDRTYSFLAAVRTSVAGGYQLLAGTYAGSMGYGTVVELNADRWTWLTVEGLKVAVEGQPYFALRSASGDYAGDESIFIDCMEVVEAATFAENTNGGRAACPRGERGGAEQPAEVAPPTGASPDPKSDATQRATRPQDAEPPPADEEIELGVPGRSEQYRAALRLVGRSPASFLFGQGLGTTRYARNLGVEPPTDRDARSAAYSDFGTLLVELGWLGLALVLALAVALVLGSLAAAKRAPVGSWTRALLIAYPGVLVAIAVPAMGGVPLLNVGSAAIFWVLTGLVLASILQQRRTDPATNWRG